MKRTTRFLALTSAGAFLFLGGCASEDERGPYDQGPTTYDWEVNEEAAAGRQVEEAAPGTEQGLYEPGEVAVGEDAATPQSVAVTTIRPTQGNDVSGEVRFEGMKDGDVNMIADLQNLQPNTEYVILLGGEAAPGQQQPTHREAEVLGFVMSDELGQGYVERTVEILGVGDDIEEPISNHVLFVSPIERAGGDTGTLPAGAPRQGGEVQGGELPYENEQNERMRIGEPVGMGQAEQY